MFRDDPVNKKLRTLVRTALGQDDGYVRPANMDGSPAGGASLSFATMFIATSTPIGRERIVTIPDPADALKLLECRTGMYHVNAVAQFFREDAVINARRLKSVLEGASSVDYMRAQNIGFIRAGAATNITGVVDTFYEERAKIDLEFYVEINSSESLATYGTFPISITVDSSTLTFEVIEP